jgi:hypothetical protein
MLSVPNEIVFKQNKNKLGWFEKKVTPRNWSKQIFCFQEFQKSM